MGFWDGLKSIGKLLLLITKIDEEINEIREEQKLILKEIDEMQEALLRICPPYRKI